MNKLRDRILKIITYHTDDGTSGYALSEKQVSQMIDLVEEILEDVVPEEKTCSMADNYDWHKGYNSCAFTAKSKSSEWKE